MSAHPPAKGGGYRTPRANKPAAHRASRTDLRGYKGSGGSSQHPAHTAGCPPAALGVFRMLAASGSAAGTRPCPVRTPACSSAQRRVSTARGDGAGSRGVPARRHGAWHRAEPAQHRHRARSRRRAAPGGRGALASRQRAGERPPSPAATAGLGAGARGLRQTAEPRRSVAGARPPQPSAHAGAARRRHSGIRAPAAGYGPAPRSAAAAARGCGGRRLRPPPSIVCGGAARPGTAPPAR